MKVIKSIAEIPQIKNAVVTNGTFDGAHIGHKKILEQLINSARDINGDSVVITYWPHPRIVLDKTLHDFKLLYTIEERIEMLQNFGIDYLIVIPFTTDFAEWTAEDFVQKILVEKICAKTLIIGYNHRFGKNREGSFEYLQQNAQRFGFSIFEIPKQVIDDQGISSTKIRKALADGDVKMASAFLGKNYSFQGEVISGSKLGRKIQYPTANIKLSSEHKLIPKNGVYAVLVHYQNNVYKGMLNIGFKPTVNNNSEISVEVHIINFSKEIYGETLKIELVEKIRDEIKFNSLEELKNQLSADEKKVSEMIYL